MPPSLQGDYVHGINAAGPRSDYCTIYQHVYTRAVSYYQVYSMTHINKKDRILPIKPRNTIAVTDVKNRDMNGFSKQPKIPDLAHTGEYHTSRPSCPHEQKARLLHPTSLHASLLTGQLWSWHQCSRPPLRLLCKLSTCIYRYGIILYRMAHINLEDRILPI